MSSMSAAAQSGGLEGKLNRANSFFDLSVNLRSRLLLVVAALLLIPTFLFPLYNMTLYSNQFPDGLNLHIYSYSLEGGHTPGRDDLREINTLNHYIGMRPLLENDFSEFKWLPLIVGLFFILTLRAAVVGKMSNLVDVSVMFLYFGLFSLWSFYHRLSQYGHNLDPTAAVKIPPFSPPLFGEKQLANFTVYNYPGPASFLLVGFFLLVAVAVWLSRKRVGAR
jgi:hypothetical protein